MYNVLDAKLVFLNWSTGISQGFHLVGFEGVGKQHVQSTTVVFRPRFFALRHHPSSPMKYTMSTCFYSTLNQLIKNWLHIARSKLLPVYEPRSLCSRVQK